MKASSAKVLVAGASGDVGREVVRCLVRQGVDVRAADPELERVRVRDGAREISIDVTRLDLRDASSYDDALEGCDGLFLTRPTALADAKPVLRFVDRALERGVDHVVFLSAAGAADSRLAPQHPIEHHLHAHSDRFTVLRPGFFCQNLGSVYRHDLAEDGRLFAPAGRARVAFVDGRDVAEVAARVFTDVAPHRKQSYLLTGPEALSFEEAADRLSAALGRPIRYEPASVVDYARHLRRRGIPLSQIAAETVLHVGLRYGQAERVDETLPRLLGRRATTFERYVTDHAHLWQKGAPSMRSPVVHAG